MIDKAPLQLYCSGLAFSPSESIVRTQFQDEAIQDIKVYQASQFPRTWNANLQTLEGHSRGVIRLSFSPDSQTVASSSLDCSIKLWDVKTGKRLHSLREHSGVPRALAFSPDGQSIASADNSSLRIWDGATGEQLQVLENLSNIARGIIFSADSQAVILACNGFLKSWNCRTGEELWTRKLDERLEDSLMAFSSVTAMVALSDSRSITIWDYRNGKELRKLSLFADSPSSMAFSPDGRLLGVVDRSIQIWHVESGKQLRIIEVGPPGGLSIWGLDFSPDSQAVIASKDGSIQLWNVETGKLLRTFTGHADVFSVSFSPDGQTIASGSYDGIVKLWDAKANEGEHTLVEVRNKNESPAPLPHDEQQQPAVVSWGSLVYILSVEVSPDGQTVAASFTGGYFKLWDAQSGNELRTFKYPSEITGCMAFSPDSGTIALTPWDSTIRIWDVKAREELQPLMGHTGNVRTVSFSPDSQLMVSCTDNDDAPKLWNVKEGRELRTLDQKSSEVGYVSFSPDGQILGRGAGETITLWNITTGKKLAPSEDRSTLNKPVGYQYYQKRNRHGRLSATGRWLTHEQKRLLWLPSEYRDCWCMDEKNGVVAMGYHDGRVLIIRLGCETN